MNPWIPCSERMPEEDEGILFVVIAESGNKYVRKGTMFTRGFYCDSVDAEYELSQVTHWMPLPELP